MSRILAEYLIETPFDVAQVAAMMAGEQSSGTFVRVAGETDDLRARAAAEVVAIEELEQVAAPSLLSAYVLRKGRGRPLPARAGAPCLPDRKHGQQPADPCRHGCGQPL